MGEARYITLVASLPALGPVLAAKAPPIGRERLAARLRSGLTSEDAAELRAISGLLSWAEAQRLGSDAEAVTAARRTMAGLRDATLRTYVRDRLELRTLIAALRRRAAGEGPPAADAAWGVGRYLRRIRANWSDPGFGTAHAFPWVPRAAQAIAAGDAAGMERIALEAAWVQAERRAARHRFDFEAVVYYVARYALLERWTRYDAQGAEARFRDMLDRAAATAPVPQAEPAR